MNVKRMFCNFSKSRLKKQALTDDCRLMICEIAFLPTFLKELIYILKKIGLVVKPDKKTTDRADEFEKWLQSKGVNVVRKESSFPGRMHSGKRKACAPSDMYCIFVLGGDGTFLNAVRWIGDQNIPILGAKFGEVGFLAEVSEESLFSTAETVLNNKFITEPRMRLQVKVIRDKKELVRETVLNDVVINKRTLARLAHVETYINDRYLTTYRADGLIISTPTGSTAYSLSAGGPIIHPAVPAIIMTPICPFTLANRPLILPDSALIKIRLTKESSDIMLTFDGQTGLEISERDTILIKKGRHFVNMITMPDQNYFDVLKTKLRWSGDRM